MPDMYKLGALNALARLGLGQNDESHLERNIAVGSLAAAPFAGLIGRQKLIHDPYAGANIPRTEKLRELAKQMRAGDVLVSADPKWSGWRIFQAPTTGSHFYHSDQVVAPNAYFLAGQRSIDPINPRDKEFWHQGEFLKEKYESAIQAREVALRDIATTPPRRAIWQAQKVESIPEHGYTESVLLRPKKELTPEDFANIKRVAVERARIPYDAREGVKGVLHELFVPKLNWLQRLRERLSKRHTVCKGHVCSTYPAQTLNEAGIINRIVKGKGPTTTLSADFLRSKELSPVLHYRAAGQKIPMSQKTLQRLGLLSRAGLGLGLGGLTYGLSEDPTLAAGVTGTALAPIAVRAAMNKIKPESGYKTFRPIHRGLSDLNRFAEKGEEALRGLKGLKNIGGRTIPLALAGGLATYLGAKGIQKAIRTE